MHGDEHKFRIAGEHRKYTFPSFHSSYFLFILPNQHAQTKIIENINKNSFKVIDTVQLIRFLTKQTITITKHSYDLCLTMHLMPNLRKW